jgi:hypothetical protein
MADPWLIRSFTLNAVTAVDIVVPAEMSQGCDMAVIRCDAGDALIGDFGTNGATDTLHAGVQEVIGHIVGSVPQPQPRYSAGTKITSMKMASGSGTAIVRFVR